MSDVIERKLFLGPKLRRLRRDLGVTQARMAEDLGVSASYLNLLERNQRPVTAQVLLRLADAYDLDLRTFSSEGEGGDGANLSEAMVRLYRAYADRRRLTSLSGVDPREAVAALTPSDWVRDFIQGQKNY